MIDRVHSAGGARLTNGMVYGIGQRAIGKAAVHTKCNLGKQPGRAHDSDGLDQEMLLLQSADEQRIRHCLSYQQ